MKSKDYNKLYEMISAGEIIPAFVDYNFVGGVNIYRDVCAVKRNKEYDIHIYARGICYNSIYEFDRDNGFSELELFINMCESLNLEYYC